MTKRSLRIEQIPEEYPQDAQELVYLAVVLARHASSDTQYEGETSEAADARRIRSAAQSDAIALSLDVLRPLSSGSWGDLIIKRAGPMDFSEFIAETPEAKAA